MHLYPSYVSNSTKRKCDQNLGLPRDTIVFRSVVVNSRKPCGLSDTDRPQMWGFEGPDVAQQDTSSE